MNVPVYVAVNTKSGVCVVGRLVDEDELELVVESDNGTEVTIQRKDISNMRELSNSSSDDDILWYLPLL
jgi:preprotein translocase subunit YajC